MSDKKRLQIQRIKEENRVKIIFGPHHYINIFQNEEGTQMELGCTHHGVKFDASIVDSEWYNVIEFLRKQYPEHKTD